jgi:hypothetical protein
MSFVTAPVNPGHACLICRGIRPVRHGARPAEALPGFRIMSVRHPDSRVFPVFFPERTPAGVDCTGLPGHCSKTLRGQEKQPELAMCEFDLE